MKAAGGRGTSVGSNDEVRTEGLLAGGHVVWKAATLWEEAEAAGGQEDGAAGTRLSAAMAR